VAERGLARCDTGGSTVDRVEVDPRGFGGDGGPVRGVDVDDRVGEFVEELSAPVVVETGRCQGISRAVQRGDGQLVDASAVSTPSSPSTSRRYSDVFDTVFLPYPQRILPARRPPMLVGAGGPNDGLAAEPQRRGRPSMRDQMLFPGSHNQANVSTTRRSRHARAQLGVSDGCVGAGLGAADAHSRCDTDKERRRSGVRRLLPGSH